MAIVFPQNQGLVGSGKTGVFIGGLRSASTGGGSASPLARLTLTETARTLDSIDLSWDNPDSLSSFELYRNGVLVSTQAGTTYSATSLPLGETSYFSVRGTDGEFFSPSSNVITHVAALQQPVLTEVSKTDTTINLSGTNPDNLPDVELYQDGVLISEGSLTTWELTQLEPATPYTFTHRVGSGGNWSPMSAPLTVTTDEAGSEPEINIAFVNKTSSSIAVSINANFVIGEYDVLVNGELWTNTFGNESGFDVTGLNAETEYTIQINDNSVLSNVITETTEAAVAPEPENVLIQFSDFVNGSVLVDDEDWIPWLHEGVNATEARRLVVNNGLLNITGAAGVVPSQLGYDVFGNGGAVYQGYDLSELDEYTVRIRYAEKVGAGAYIAIMLAMDPSDPSSYIFWRVGSSNANNASYVRLRQVENYTDLTSISFNNLPNMAFEGDIFITIKRNDSISFSMDTVDGLRTINVLDYADYALSDLPLTLGVSIARLETSRCAISEIELLNQSPSWQEPEETYNGLNGEIVDSDIIINTDKVGVIYYIVNQSSDDLAPEFIEQNATGFFETVAGSDLMTQPETGWFHAVLWDGAQYSNVIKLEVL